MSAPLFASERTAAKLMDMRPAEFIGLVEKGLLPQPCQIDEGVKRWRVADLDRIQSGEAEEEGPVQWRS